jgi:Tfp pilus assembly protein PilF
MCKYKESHADFNKTLKIKPNDAVILSNQGVTYCVMGKYKEADFNWINIKRYLQILTNY